MDLKTAILFDKDLNAPIIWGSKTIVVNTLKNIHEEMNVDKSIKITIYSYILGQDGFRRIQTYNGPIDTIGKYLMRY
jgi:hypothetical protein